MAEYVDRDGAVSALEKALYSYEDETEKKFKEDPELDLAEWFFHRIFVQVMNGHDRQAILDLPAADVRPVVRGKWTMHSDYPDRLLCSECGTQFDVWHWEAKQMHFCPNCGADMREKADGT